MPYVFRYLVSLALQLVWARAGKKGVAPIRMKPGGKSMPVIGPWQLMIGTWIVKKLWARYGHEITTRANNARHPAVRTAASIINGTPGPLLSQSAPAASSTAPTPPTVAAKPPVVVSNAPNSYGTQVLDDNANVASTAPAASAKRGTLLDRLRGNS